MTQKLRIAKDNFSADAVTDLNNIVYDSEYDTLKYYASGLISISISKTASDPPYQSSDFVTHNLGYYPYFHVYVKHLTNWQMIGSSYVTAGYGSGSGVYRKFQAFVTTTRLYVTVDGDTDGVSDSYTADFRYKIYRNNIGL